MGDSPDTGSIRREFRDRVERLLDAIDHAFDDLANDHDIDVQRAGQVLTIAFESGRRVVVNSQEANAEVWLADRSGGFHYRFDATTSRWLDTRGAEDFATRIARIVAEETGAPFEF